MSIEDAYIIELQEINKKLIAAINAAFEADHMGEVWEILETALKETGNEI